MSKEELIGGYVCMALILFIVIAVSLAENRTGRIEATKCEVKK